LFTILIISSPFEYRRFCATVARVPFGNSEFLGPDALKLQAFTMILQGHALLLSGTASDVLDARVIRILINNVG
jgi:hypothetical protein